MGTEGKCNRSSKIHIYCPEFQGNTFCGLWDGRVNPHTRRVLVADIPQRLGDICKTCWKNFGMWRMNPSNAKLFRDRITEAKRHLSQNRATLRRFFGHGIECQCWECLGKPSPEGERLIEEIAQFLRTQSNCKCMWKGPDPCWQCREKALNLYMTSGISEVVKKAYCE